MPGKALEIRKRRQLIAQLDLSELSVNGGLECWAPSGRASIVDLQHVEAAIGEMLPQQAGSPFVTHSLNTRTSVDHQHRRVSALPPDLARPKKRAVERRAIRGLDKDELARP